MSLPSPTEIAVRAYTEKPEARPVAVAVAEDGGFDRNDTPSKWSLIFDCETTTDAAQDLRFGVFQVRKGDQLDREGIFFDPDGLGEANAKALQTFALSRGLECISANAFRSEVFLKVGYQWRGQVIGFNLPFDLSRIAIDHSPARRSMRGGFSFQLTKWKSDPTVRVKHLSRRAALIDFAAPGKQMTPRGMRKRDLSVPHNPGFFVDVKTLAASLHSRSFSLASLCEHLTTPTQKLETGEHGGPITPDYLDYARADVQATWEAYAALKEQYDGHGLKTGVHRILSEASIGKAYFKEMGIKPFLANQPDFPREVFGKIMCSYYGGRAEVRIRRQSTQVLYWSYARKLVMG